MADSRLSFTEVRQLLDNIAKAHQLLKAVADGGFTGEGTNTVLYALRYLVETRMRAWTSDSAIRDIVPNAVNALKKFDVTDSSGTTKLLAPHVCGILAKTLANVPSFDTTYASFWTWWNAAKAASPNDKVLGEVAELMLACGMSVDPDHCVAPENRKLARILFSGVSTAALTHINALDPTIYKGHTVEVYCVARNVAPDEIVLTVNNCKNSGDSATDTGSTDFPITIPNTLAADQVMDVVAVDDDTIYSTEDATLTITSGGKINDDFYLRVKQYRAAAV
jgi:hypothetical protein